MAKINLLTEGFVYNRDIPGIREITPSEMDGLLDIDGQYSIPTSSGDVIDLVMDLGFMHSVSQLRYRITPLSLSGVQIKYGREMDDLVTASLQVAGGEIIVTPSISGYTFPRYFTLYHETGGADINRLSVENTDEEIEFGGTGNLQSLTLVSPITGGYGSITEIPVLNSGSVTSDIFVTVDTSRTSREVFENLELSPTVTGTFYAVNPNKVPNTIPWQWGIFTNSSVDNNNNLVVTDPEAPSPGTRWGTGNVPGEYTWRTRCQEDVTKDGVLVYPRMGDSGGGLKLQFVNGIAQTIQYTSGLVPYSSQDDNTNKYFINIAYDGQHTLYWLRGASNSGGARELYKYDMLSNVYSLVRDVPDYNTFSGKGLIYKEGYLYILGGTATSQTSSTTGTRVTRYDIEGDTFLSMAPLPQSPALAASFVYGDGYIYYVVGENSSRVYRYSISGDHWTMLADWPHGASTTHYCTQASWNKNLGELWGARLERANDCSGLNNTSAHIFRYTPSTNQWISDPVILSCYNNGGSASTGTYEMTVLNKGTAVFSRGVLDNSSFEVIDYPPINKTATWISPVFLVRQGIATSGVGEEDLEEPEFDSFHRVLIDREQIDTIRMSADNNLSVESFEVRASNISPAGDNTVENFTNNEIETERHVVGNTEGVLMGQGENGIEFDHSGISSVSAGYLYLNESFASTGNMQYKFWWQPPTSKNTGNSLDRTSVYIVPFLDTLNTGISPVRDSSTLRRTGNGYIRIYLGSQSDTEVFTSLAVFKGGTAGTDTFTITARAGRFYEVVFIMNWETGNYSIRFDGSLLGTGFLPLSSRELFQPQHSLELYSSSTGTGNALTEYFRHLTISRIGLEARQEFSASPLHIDDPVYGLNGSLAFSKITDSSAILPIADYLQVKLTFEAQNTIDARAASALKFPPLIRLAEVDPGQSKSVFIRYNFPSVNSLLQEKIYLKAYMATDKV